MRDALGRLLGAEGFAVRLHASAEALLNVLEEVTAGCIVTDLHMPGLNGLQLIGRLRAEGCAMPCILVTGRIPAGVSTDVLARLDCELIPKPFGPDAVIAAVRRALERR